MKNRAGLNNFFSQDRKTLYMVLSVLVLSIFTLTMVYAALSTTLQINGQAEVSAANWDIHLDNVQLNSQSVTTNVPTITDSKTATFSTTLTKPGDYYMFTIDVVNNGSIDAMIDSVTKTPELSDSQKKYLNYIVEYQNGEAVTTKQLVAKKSFVRLKIKVEFRKDINASDLPKQLETLDLAFTVKYTQADETGTSVPNNGESILKVVNGDLKTVGSEVAIGDEHFYIISSDEDSVTMLSKMNITIDAIPKQSNSAPTIAFSSTNYWYDGSALKSEYGTSYPVYVYDSNSSIYNYVESYRTYLESHGAAIEEARLIKVEELEALGCSRASASCSGAPSWVYGTTYWSGAANVSINVWYVYSIGEFHNYYYSNNRAGIRPVIVLKA